MKILQRLLKAALIVLTILLAIATCSLGCICVLNIFIALFQIGNWPYAFLSFALACVTLALTTTCIDVYESL